MATSISIRGWWTTPPARTSAALAQLLRALPLPPPTHLAVRDARGQALFRHGGPIAAAALPAWPDAPGSRAGATAPLACWRFAPHQEPARAAVPVTAYASDPAWFGATGTDRAVEGDVSLVIEPVGPFCALPEGAPDAAAVNPRVEENVEGVLELVKALARAGELDAIAVTTDAGEPLPVNDHMAWFRDAEAAAVRARWLRRVCAEGLPAYRIPALGGGDPGRAQILHEWRSAEQRQALAAALAGATTGPDPDAERVRAVLASRRFDWMEDPGILVLDYPHPFNAFLDGFWLALLG